MSSRHSCGVIHQRGRNDSRPSGLSRTLTYSTSRPSYICFTTSKTAMASAAAGSTISTKTHRRSSNSRDVSHNDGASPIPDSHYLLVTTANGVYSWSSKGVAEIFRSGSGGIVAARQTAGTGDILAVADSQVVLLHDLKKGMQNSYRLKATDVCSYLACQRWRLLT